MSKDIQIGVIGGTGFYTLMDNPEMVDMSTNENKPSDLFMIGTINNNKVAFLSRHGNKHNIPPHMVPYKSNTISFANLGVTRLIGITAVGSLRKDYKPGDLVFTDQFINMTSGRKDTFFDNNPVTHISTAFPYCNELRGVAAKSAERLGLSYHTSGTVMVVNGPRFSTKAESKLFKNMGADIINMTQYPEVVLAKEKCMCYLNISFVTDYDIGLDDVIGSEGGPVSYIEVKQRFEESIGNIKKLVADIISNIPEERGCTCKDSLKGSSIIYF